ncbi:hypothetical protein [Allorhizobium taibaishanense]|uniref:Uncharacterized protein n=1 Tax=Allorhizobium taibaishanense TaxID=887144 RepID=A0A7W6MWN4_9HYPH|nr:hypothetical protein [Allorhizobium taibaishanense]MBB4010414.1 hypothetical protein [Allorhizobium taibaishanense]
MLHAFSDGRCSWKSFNFKQDRVDVDTHATLEERKELADFPVALAGSGVAVHLELPIRQTDGPFQLALVFSGKNILFRQWFVSFLALSPAKLEKGGWRKLPDSAATMWQDRSSFIRYAPSSAAKSEDPRADLIGDNVVQWELVHVCYFANLAQVPNSEHVQLFLSSAERSLGACNEQRHAARALAH